MDAWRNEDCIQLIQEYQIKPVLWNPTNEFYFSKIKKQDAWEEIGKNMKKNTEEIKKKALSLLGSFRREKAKGKKSMGTGKGRKDIYTSKWFAFEAFQFLLDRDDPRPTITTDNDNDTELENNLEQNENEFAERNVDLSQEIDILSQEEDIVEERSFTIPKQPPIKKKKTSDTMDKCLEEAMQILKRPYPTVTTPDEWVTYGQHVANKLRKYDSQTSSIVQHYINNILFEANMGRYSMNVSYINQPAQYSNFQSPSTPSATFSQCSPLSSMASPHNYFVPMTSFSPNEPLYEFLSPTTETQQIDTNQTN